MGRNLPEIGTTLRRARLERGLTQAQVAPSMGVSRTAVVQMENGKRSVKAAELTRLAEYYGCGTQELLGPQRPDEAEGDQEVSDLLGLLSELSDNEAERSFRDVLEVARGLHWLERLLGYRVIQNIPVTYSPEQPTTTWQAVRQGHHVAQDERRRQALGEGPIRFVDELLATLGIRGARAPLPAGITSISMNQPSLGTLVVVADQASLGSRRLSYAHGLAHALFDRDSPWRVCRAGSEEDVREVRATAFATDLLLPEHGVRRYVESMGRETLGRSGPTVLSVFSEPPGGDVGGKTLRVDGRAREGRGALTLAGLTRVAHYFGVGRRVTAHRLRNLRLVTQEHLHVLETLLRGDAERNAAQTLSLPTPGVETDSLPSRLAAAAAEAQCQDLISRAEFDRFAAIAGVKEADREALLAMSRK